MNKINLLNVLLKLIRIKKQLVNPLSRTLCCKSYIFDEQFNTTDIKSKLYNLDKNIFTRTELVEYDPIETEDILLWFQTHKCKTPTDKLIIENLQLNSSYEWFKLINENTFVQNLLHYSNMIVPPLTWIVFICVLTCIFIYYLFMVKFNIRFPLNSFVNIIKNSILIRNNFMSLFMSRLKLAKYVISASGLTVLIYLGIHIYSIMLLLNDTETLYKKIKLFRRQIRKMRNISERLCDMSNETVDFFLENLNGNEFYEHEGNMKCFLLKNRGNIISDYFKIANKKNKLGKLFQLNGMCCYMKIQ